MKHSKVSCSSRLYSEHQAICTGRVKKSHLNKVYYHKDKLHMAEKLPTADKPHVAKTYFSMETYKQIVTIASGNE